MFFWTSKLTKLCTGEAGRREILRRLVEKGEGDHYTMIPKMLDFVTFETFCPIIIDVCLIDLHIARFLTRTAHKEDNTTPTYYIQVRFKEPQLNLRELCGCIASDLLNYLNIELWRGAMTTTSGVYCKYRFDEAIFPTLPYDVYTFVINKSGLVNYGGDLAEIVVGYLDVQTYLKLYYGLEFYHGYISAKQFCIPRPELTLRRRSYAASSRTPEVRAADQDLANRFKTSVHSLETLHLQRSRIRERFEIDRNRYPFHWTTPELHYFDNISGFFLHHWYIPLREWAHMKQLADAYPKTEEDESCDSGDWSETDATSHSSDYSEHTSDREFIATESESN